LKGEPFVTRFTTGLLEPKNSIPGKEMGGRVEAVGQNVTQFQPGDEVFGDLSVASWGAFAEYVAVPESAIALKPTNLTFEEAAAVPESAVVALQGLRDKGKIQPGQKVLINGASGGVGLYAVQIAKAFGAEVTAVCSTRNMALVRSLGADHVIDYTKEDFTQNGQQYDLILAVNGYHPISDYRRALSSEGIYVATGGSMKQTLQATMIGPFISMTGGKKMGGMLVKPNQNDLVFIKELIEANKVKPVIDKRYPLSKAADAFHYMEAGRAQGKIVITM
jgi:NADPH:quinone reductase-like Zn-dependent oxidoreductase